jgi:FAD:protein FMN transferase
MLSAFSRPSVVRYSFLAMGTDVQITLAPSRRQMRETRPALSRIQQLIREFGHDGWAWGDGALGRFNRQLAQGERVAIPASLRPLFDRAWALHLASGGRYEPRIAGLVRLWGFDDVARIRSQPPPADEIAACMDALRQAPDYDPADSHYGPAPGIGWDFGGIAKGYIVDDALERLRGLGFDNATVDAGGNVSARGRRQHRAWRIGIRHPLLEGEDVDNPRLMGLLEVADESVNTHGDDQRFFIHQGRRYAHLLDPRSGEPVQGLRSLTVVHRDGMLAEAGGAALFVAGASQWRALAQSLGIEQVLVVHEDGRIEATAALAARLRAEPDVVIHSV